MFDVRPAKESDVPVLAELNRIVQELHLSQMPERFKPVDVAAVSDWFRSMLGNPSACVWIAELGGSPLGYAVAVTHDRPETPFCSRRVFCELDQIAVAPAHRKEGVARALMSTVLADARSRGIRHVELSS